MAKIAIDRAPPTALPRRFLLSSPAWVAFAGALLLWQGESALQSRWAPATLALVHALTLGAWGNAMSGSLLQFLPAAAGVRVHLGTRAGLALHALLNAGALLLVAGFLRMQPRWLLVAATLLGLAFALLAAMVLPGLQQRLREQWRAPAGCVLPAGVTLALVAALATATLGIGMLLALAGHRGLPLLPWIDVHAGWGLLGWMLGLLAAIGGVTLPMFQGTHPLPARGQWAWLLAVASVLVAGGCALVVHGVAGVLRYGAASCAAAFALAGLAWQLRARHVRNAWLVRSWRAGLLAVLWAAAVLALDGSAVMVGALLLAVAMPLLVGGMQLEIVAFLGWIELTRRCPRGVRLPPVQRLLPEGAKGRVFALQLVAAVAVLAAVRWPAFAPGAGAALLASASLLLWTLLGVQRRVHAFLRMPAASAPAGEGREGGRR